MDDIERKALKLLADALGTSVDYLVENRNTPNMTSYDEVLSAIIAALTPPEGYVLVPVEPTEAMERVAFAAAGYPTNWGGLREIWSAVLAERPEEK